MFKKISRLTLGAVFTTLFLGFLIFILYPWGVAIFDFRRTQYNFVVDEIQYRPGHRGIPHFRHGSEWYFLRSSNEYELIPVVQVGDSLVKAPGSSVVKVYRKEMNNGYVLISK